MDIFDKNFNKSKLLFSFYAMNGTEYTGKNGDSTNTIRKKISDVYFSIMLSIYQLKQSNLKQDPVNEIKNKEIMDICKELNNNKVTCIR